MTPTNYQTALFFTHGGHFNLGKMIWGQLASAAMMFLKFHASTRQLLSDFWPLLLEKVPIKLDVLKIEPTSQSGSLISQFGCSASSVLFDPCDVHK